VELIRYLYILLIIIISGRELKSQPAPAVDENIHSLITFGGNAVTSWGDDDFCQIFFFVVPYSQTSPVYLRVFDPDTGGDLDEVKGGFNTVVNFSIYGGTGCWSDTAAQSIHPGGNFKSGYLMTERNFGTDPKFDKKWHTFGPLSPFDGEKAEKLGGHVFKIIAQGISGDDDNIYKYFLSTNPDENIPVEGGNLFTCKYHFRLPDNQKEVCHIYPFADDKTISVQISNFDWDNDGIIRVFSVAKNGINCEVSGEDNWISKTLPIVEEEKNSSIEIQFIKNQNETIRNFKGIILLLLPISLPVINADPQDYNFRSFSSSEGLAAPYVYSTIQESQGYLWIGTADGLSKYNVFTFKTFTIPDSVADNFITSAIDDGSCLWFGHRNGRITWFDGKKFKPVNYNGRQLSSITHFAKSPDGRI